MGACCSDEGLPPVNPDAVDLTHFELLKVVGKGGFGKVNAVENRNDGKLYAMKTITKLPLLESASHRKTVWIERTVLAMFRSKFLVHVHWAFQDAEKLYLVMHFMRGGDLRYYLDENGKMTESQARFYTSEILLALEEMTSHTIVYRDLKPENVLLDEDGHLRVSDFGLCAILGEDAGFKVRGQSGTTGYMAPEVVSTQPYDFSQDVWSFGVVLYEFVHKHLPFSEKKAVIEDEPKFRKQLSDNCVSLIEGLLTKNCDERLGCGPGRWNEVKQHPWFADIDWEVAKERQLVPPFIPQADVANCSALFDLEDQFFTDTKKQRALTDKEQTAFKGFDYRTNHFAVPEQHDKESKSFRPDGSVMDLFMKMKGRGTGHESTAQGSEAPNVGVTPEEPETDDDLERCSALGEVWLDNVSIRESSHTLTSTPGVSEIGMSGVSEIGESSTKGEIELGSHRHKTPPST